MQPLETPSPPITPTPWRRAWKRLSRILLGPRVPLWQYVLWAWLLAMGPSLMLIVAAAGMAELSGLEWRQQGPSTVTVSLAGIGGTVLFAPLAETWLLGITLWLCRKFASGRMQAALVAAVFWGLLHGLLTWSRFFGSVWSFFVFSCAFLAWRPRSYRHAFIAAAVPHALLNATAWAALALLG